MSSVHDDACSAPGQFVYFRARRSDLTFLVLHQVRQLQFDHLSGKLTVAMPPVFGKPIACGPRRCASSSNSSLGLPRRFLLPSQIAIPCASLGARRAVRCRSPSGALQPPRGGTGRVLVLTLPQTLEDLLLSASSQLSLRASNSLAGFVRDFLLVRLPPASSPLPPHREHLAPVACAKITAMWCAHRSRAAAFCDL